MEGEELIPFAQVLEEHLRNPEFRAEWERLAPARTLANWVIGYRADHGLTQTALARLLGMPQAAVSRLEIAEQLPSWETLVRLAERLGIAIVVEIMPPTRNRDAPDSKHPDASVTESTTTSRGTRVTVSIR